MPVANLVETWYCPLERECEDYLPQSDVCNDINLARKLCSKYKLSTKEAVNVYACRDSRKPRDYKQGWYTLCDMDFLTKAAIMKHFGISRKTFDAIISMGKVATDTLINPHNSKWFTVYHLYSVQELLKKFNS